MFPSFISLTTWQCPIRQARTCLCHPRALPTPAQEGLPGHFGVGPIVVAANLGASSIRATIPRFNRVAYVISSNLSSVKLGCGYPERHARPMLQVSSSCRKTRDPLAQN